MSTRWLAALGIGTLCLLASACGSSGSPTTTTTTTTTSTTTTTVPARSTTTVTGVPTTVAPATALCTGPNVGVSGAMASAAAGHQGVVLLFVNHGPANCLLFGYPGVAGLNANGAQVVQAQRTLTGMMGGLAPGVTTVPRVTLAPGQTASAVVEGTDVPSGTETSCPTYPSLLVTAPNTMTSVMIPLALPGCSGLEVHPVVPGMSGSTQF
jgi:Protein of unknown function (DUF4232)